MYKTPTNHDLAQKVKILMDNMWSGVVIFRSLSVGHSRRHVG